MNMKFILFFLMLITVSTYSQEKKERMEQIKALKVSYLTTELNLTSEQAEKFWPVYNVYDDKSFDIGHNKIRPIIRKMDGPGIEKLSDKEASAYLNQLETAEEDLLALRKKLVSDLKPVIGPVKLLKLKKAEDDFKRRLLSQYRNKGKKK